MASEAVLRGTLTPANRSLKDDYWSAAAADALTVDKQAHVHKGATDFDIVIGTVPTAKEKQVYVVTAVGTIRGFHALLNDTGTVTSVTFDLLKNGVSILTAPITITNANADRSVQDGTLSSASVAIGDVLSIALAVSTSTGAKGPYAWVDVVENVAP